MRTVLLAGDRLFMKFPNLDYFYQRAAEVDATIVEARDVTDDELTHLAHNASAIIVIGRPISRETIEACSACELIMALSVGFDVVDVTAASERGIPVSNCPLYCSEEVADHAISLSVALRRKLEPLHRHVIEGGWTYRHARPIHSFRNTTFGIVGLGRIGRHAARKATALGMRIVAYDPYVDDDIFDMLDVERVYDLYPLLRTSDIVTIHAPLNDETWHLFNEEALSYMKTESVLINTARGAIVDRRALERALDAGVIAGAGVDVLEDEPPTGEEPLLSHPNAIVTPHIAWYSEESHARNMIHGMDELVRVLRGDRPRHIVNPTVLSRRRAPVSFS